MTFPRFFPAVLLLLIISCSGETGDDTGLSDGKVVALQASAGSQYPTVVKDAYAPWAKMEQEAYAAVHPSDAPRASDIDIPPFPESYIISSGRIGEGTTGLRFVTLICTDAPESVQSFYLRELVDKRAWTYASQYHVFQPGSGNDFLVNNTPFVSVTTLNPHSEELRFVDRDFLAEFHTRIQITYR
ncbi:MAG: hypothetical protein JXA28_13910 [Bacteroidetes bacterium]|nr:hypothetical protein [Bacteroidota bacterium]